MAERQGNGKEAVKNAETAAKLLTVVRDLAAELHPRKTAVGPATLDSALDRDLGFDSLGLVELLVRIERAFDITVPEQVLGSAETPRDLLRAVLGAEAPSGTPAAAEIKNLSLGETEAAPFSAGTLVEVLEWHVQAHPERPHIRLYSDLDEGKTITYRALKEAAERLARGLQDKGLKAGESVAIMLPTGADYFFSFFGILLAGGVPVPIYPPARLKQIEEHLNRHAAILDNCLAGILITVPEAKQMARLLAPQVPSLHHVATVNELSSVAGKFRKPALTARDTAFLQYTSGSTGRPKGVVLTHGNLLANIRAMGEAIGAGPTDVFVSWLPLYHDMGLIGAWLGSLHYANLLVIMSPLSFLARPQRWLWAIHRHGGTLSAAPNFAYELCLRRIDDKDLDGLDLSSWRNAFNGAEAVRPETVGRFCQRFAKYGFRRQAITPVYGLAESSVGLAFPPRNRGPLVDCIRRDDFTASGDAVPATEEDAKALRFIACGRPLPGHQVRIVDAGGRELPERQEGWLQFRGPSVTSGYFRNPQATRRLFKGDWLDSGDRAYIATGDVYITGRAKDIIIRAGRNIHPDELEEAIGDVPGIRKGNVAVFGSADPDSGTERLVILVETRKREAAALDQLRSKLNALATDLAGGPADDLILAPPNSVLKTSSGKIRRAASRKLYEKGGIGKPQRAVWWQIARLLLAGMTPRLRRARSTVAAAIYAAHAWSLLLLVAPFTWLLVAFLPREAWRWTVIRATLGFLAWASGTPLTVRGLENLPPSGQPCVFAANHASYLDGAAMIAALPGRFSFVAKAELIERFVPRLFLSRIGTQFIERFDTHKGIADSRRLVGVIRGGRALFYFAEGTFVRTPGLLPFHMGAFAAAVEAGVPVLPITIRGTRSMLRSESGFPRRGTITVVVGKPLDPGQAKTADLWAASVQLRDAVRLEILRHCGEPDLGPEDSPF